MNKSIQLFILTNFLINLNWCFELRTCCPDDYSLKIFETNKFKCIQNNNNTNSEKNPLNLINSFMILKTNQNEIPNCEKPNLIKLTKNFKFNLNNSCITFLYNQYYIIECPRTNSNLETRIQVNLLKKCCPFDHSYNLDQMRCTRNNQSIQIFENFLNFPTIFEQDDGICFQENVMLQYLSNEKSFSIQNNELILNNERINSNKFCLDGIIQNFNNSEIITNFLVRICYDKMICDRIPCIRKCCKINEKLTRKNETSVCESNSIDFKNIHFHKINENNKDVQPEKLNYSISYGLQQNQNCKKYKLSPELYSEEMNYISHNDGSLHVPGLSAVHPTDRYCIEHLETRRGLRFSTFVCFETQEWRPVKYRVYSIGLMISCAFLGLTLLVYLSVPKLLNIHGKIVIFHVACMFIAYLGLSFIQSTDILRVHMCFPVAFFIYYSFMATFCWLNIMCFDIWLTFGSTERAILIRTSSEIKRFLCYLLYAFGVPLILTCLTMAVDHYKLIDEYFLPKMGDGRCWFSEANTAAHLLFFLGPVGLLIFTNIILFILTLKYCNKVKNEIYRMQSTNSEKSSLKNRFTSDKEKFIMNIKLFIVMGISWLTEIIGTVLYNNDSESIVFQICDFFNVLQGVLVFFIFVFKKRVYHAIKQRLGIKSKSRYRSGGVISGTATSSLMGSVDLRKISTIENCSPLLMKNLTVNTSKLRSNSAINK